MALSLRTTFSVELRFDPVFVGAELLDSRRYLVDEESPLDTTLINAVEPLQLYLGAELDDVLGDGSVARVQAGRLTMDVGSRRFLARNSFRNTTNSFTGIDVKWMSSHSDAVRLFATLPVRRLPDDRDALADNQIGLDRESFSTLFLGAFYGSREWAHQLQLELYVFGLHESDEVDAPTRNRRLVTSGLRFYRSPRVGEVEVEVEAAVQLGESRATTNADDVRDLEHLALYGHSSIGYTVDVAWKPRFSAQFDYSSGDGDPEDDANGRFDPLFGARRFDLGPTGIFGWLARSNMVSPGFRIEVRPHGLVDVLLAYRTVWLAQARDSWGLSGIRDRSGDSGTFIGHQVEFQLRWRPLPGNVLLEVGLAHAFHGRFPRNAPNSTIEGDPTYVYSQLGFDI